MLIRFITSNFLSFKDETEFNMLSGNFKIHSDHIYTENNGYRILRAASIYGANASGKSNFVKAIEYVAKLVKYGTKDKNDVLNPPKFKLGSDSIDLPTSFEIEFLIDSKVYSYAISILNGVIKREWLINIVSNKKEKIIFDRITDKNKKANIKFGSEPKNPKDRLRREIYSEDLRFNQPFIYEGYNKNILEISPAYEWFVQSLNFIYPDSTFGGIIKSIDSNSDFKEKATKLLKSAGTGIVSIEVENIDIDKFFGVEEQETKKEILSKIDKNTIAGLKGNNGEEYDLYLDENGQPKMGKLFTYHENQNGQKVKFELMEESEGTRRIIDLIPAFIDSVEKGKTYIIDEIDRSMHPLLIKSLLELYLESDNTISKGQFIFTTHESNLLDLSIFRQDEIWFMEKNKGATVMYSLSDFKPRYDKDIKKGYLQGMFGAIPFESELSKLNWN